jgi:hypothetical protein
MLVQTLDPNQGLLTPIKLLSVRKNNLSIVILPKGKHLFFKQNIFTDGAFIRIFFKQRVSSNDVRNIL